MNTSYILSFLATIASLLITGIGFPVQIWKNYKTKNTSGVSYILFLLSFLSYALWSLRAYVIKDWYMVTAYTPGIFFSTIILFQIYFYRNLKVKQIIDEGIKSGKCHTLSENIEVIKFLKRIPLKKAMWYANKIDNNFEIWKLVLQKRKVSFENMIECAEKYHHSIVWPLALDRIDIQEHLLKMPTKDAIAYAEKSGKDSVWEFMLKRIDVQTELNKMCLNDAIQYSKKINTPFLEEFFFPKYRK